MKALGRLINTPQSDINLLTAPNEKITKPSEKGSEQYFWRVMNHITIKTNGQKNISPPFHSLLLHINLPFAYAHVSIELSILEVYSIATIYNQNPWSGGSKILL